MQTDELMETDEVQALMEAMCLVRTPAEARSLLVDLCTPKEIEDFGQRLEVARLLASGESYVAVQQATGASSTTVSRVSKFLNGPAKGYRLVLGRLADEGSPDAPTVGTE